MESRIKVKSTLPSTISHVPSRIPPKVRPKISFVKSSQDELDKFLQSYDRVDADKLGAICERNISAWQVTFWIFQDGEWTYGRPGGVDAGSSWCHSYLASHFKWTKAEYQTMKKTLLNFDPRNIWNGVYEHQSEKQFAVVYRPVVPWKRGKIAAALGGSVIAGVGIGFLSRKLMRARQLKKLEDNARTLTSMLPKLLWLKEEVKEDMKKWKDTILNFEFFRNFALYKEGAILAAKLGDNEFINHVNFIELLIKLQLTEETFEAVFTDQNFFAITHNALFKKINLHAGQQPFEANGDTYCTFQLARAFERLANPGVKEKIPHFQQMVNLFDTCPSKTTAAVSQILTIGFDNLFYVAAEDFLLEDLRRRTDELNTMEANARLEKRDLTDKDFKKIQSYVDFGQANRQVVRWTGKWASARKAPNKEAARRLLLDQSQIMPSYVSKFGEFEKRALDVMTTQYQVNDPK